MIMVFEGKKVIIIGDRDGVPGPAIEECVKSAGAEVVFSATECFV
jgi:betaine reductase